MNEKLEELFERYVQDSSGLYNNQKIIKGSHIETLINKITELYREEEKRAINIEIENKELYAQIETKDNLINMYENIISKSNFSMILDKVEDNK